MIECEICKNEIKKGQKFVLVGTIPSKSEKFWYWLTKGSFFYGAGYNISDFGAMCHEECYLKKNKK